MHILKRRAEASPLHRRRPWRLLATLLTATALSASLASCTAAHGSSALGALPEEATAPAADVVVIGDSLSTGFMTSVDDAWPTLIQGKLAGATSSPASKGAPRSLYNAARNGAGYVTVGDQDETFGDEVRAAVTKQTKDVLFFGSDNDLGQDPQAITSAAEAALAQAHAQAPQATLIVVGPPSYTETPDAALTAIRDALQTASKAEGARFIDPITENWIAPDAANLLAADDEHPSVQGHQFLAGKMESILGIG
ncbi:MULTISPECIES: SGNH/GDSL hydrolase family protein [Arthrobacter]|uniref:SGNH/GDSL hydrolase family protein n=2 Tax=Arthrobacter TaxID=1663 RepID=A0ABU9KQ93_9MICC|nr:SGNH/GDSL hydrolase family protein [Arthrobacter sp. YJM1]MDP5228494.1 SGNH/GDSL hydrolase family protein [Arthrobacter sp. YJM1]